LKNVSLALVTKFISKVLFNPKTPQIMKKQETGTPQMDEVVFEKRNKLYGAYILRKMYNKQLVRALFVSTAILVAGLAYPLASSFRDQSHGRLIINEGDIIYLGNELPPDVEPPVLPPPPPPTTKIQNQVRFVPPVVVDDIVTEDGFLPMDDINKTQTNPVDINPETSVEKQPVIVEEPEAKKELFIIAEEMPLFPGGDNERMKFLAQNIQYPQQASELAIQGTVYIQFVVDSKGNITDVKIMRGIGGGCDEEALRVVKIMPKWHPGKQNGKTVRVLYTMPVTFKIIS
jgi:protein TonB